MIRISAQARGILSIIDVNAATLPQQPVRPAEPRYWDVEPVAQSYSQLTADGKDHYKVLMDEYRMRVEQYERQQKALVDILDFIQNTVARNLRPCIHSLSTPYAILKALEKRLASTDRTRRIELSRELQALKKGPRGQSLDAWLLQWETTFAQAEKLNLADIQDQKALYDFMQATKSVDPAYAGAYQIYVDSMLEQGGNVPTFYDTVERFRNNLRLSPATSISHSYRCR